MTNADTLQEIYLDWRNNYLTVEKFAEHKGLTVDEAHSLIQLCDRVHHRIVSQGQS